jgi:hypothetical protein
VLGRDAPRRAGDEQALKPFVPKVANHVAAMDDSNVILYTLSTDT